MKKLAVALFLSVGSFGRDFVRDASDTDAGAEGEASLIIPTLPPLRPCIVCYTVCGSVRIRTTRR